MPDTATRKRKVRKQQPVIAWALQWPSGKVQSWTNKPTRMAAIHAAIEMKKSFSAQDFHAGVSWPSMRRLGYKIVRVQIKVLP